MNAKDLAFSIPNTSVREIQMSWIEPSQSQIGTSQVLDELYGSFVEEWPPFNAIFTEGFWIGKFQVTRSQWNVIVGGDNETECVNENLPIVKISWLDTMRYCQKLNRLFQSQLPSDYRFCLPTEVQWELACRHRSQSIDNARSVTMNNVAWYKENSGGEIHPVGEKCPNELGLFDMLGNVYEWCFDSPTDYPYMPENNWSGMGNGVQRAFRGGCFATPLIDYGLSCEARGSASPTLKDAAFGFRLALWPVGDEEIKRQIAVSETT